MVQVDDGLYGQRPRTLGPVEGEVPPLAACVLTLESEGTAEEDSEGAVRAQLGERTVLQHSTEESMRMLRRGETLTPGDTYSHFTQIYPIIQRVPCTLLVVGPPRLLEDLVDALALLAFHAVAARDAWRPWDAIGPWVTISSWGACWPLHAVGILGEKREVRP